MLLVDRADMLVADMRGWGEVTAAWLIVGVWLAGLWLV